MRKRKRKRKRKRRGMPGLKGLIPSRNVVSYRSAKELGLALYRAEVEKARQMVMEPVACACGVPVENGSVVRWGFGRRTCG